MNGSAIVLNTNAEKGASSDIVKSFSSCFFTSMTFIGCAISGEGKHSSMSSNSVSVPIPKNAEPHITGAISPLLQPVINPLYISSSLSVPSLKYLSNNVSSVSATASVIMLLHSSTLSINSAGISASSIWCVFSLNILALLDITFITPLKLVSLPKGY
jgi:hypothetical protein